MADLCDDAFHGSSKFWKHSIQLAELGSSDISPNLNIQILKARINLFLFIFSFDPNVKIACYKRGGGRWEKGGSEDGETRELRGGWRGRAGRMTSFPQLPCADRALIFPSAHGGCCWGSDSSCRTQTRPEQPALLGWILKTLFNPGEEPANRSSLDQPQGRTHFTQTRGLLLVFNHDDVRVYKLRRKKEELQGWQKGRYTSLSPFSSGLSPATFASQVNL